MIQQSPIDVSPESGVFITEDPIVLEQLRLVDLVAPSNATVLVVGETGTGKELVARQLHTASKRARRPFRAVNCAAVPDSLQESLFFGHRKGAFTGANAHRSGMFEAAHEGTVFLDEISETSPGLQAKLLRVLQSGEYLPIGAVSPRNANARVVAATNRDLTQMVHEGTFREDLYYRLGVFHIELPPLRERRADIPLLVEHFARLFGDGSVELSTEAIEILCAYEYPGNVRELRNIVQYAAVVAEGRVVREHHLPRQLRGCAGVPVADLQDFHAAKARVVEEFERRFIRAALDRCGGVVRRAADQSGLSEKNFHAKLRRYGLRGTASRPVGYGRAASSGRKR